MGLILSASAVYVGVVEFLSVIDRIQRSIKFANEHKIESEAVEKLPYSQIEQDSAEVLNQNPVEFERLAEITYHKSNVSFEEDKSNYVTTDAVAALENSCTSGPMPAEGELTFESKSETYVSEETDCEIDSHKSSHTNKNSNSKCPESVEIVVKNENQNQIRDENENNMEIKKIPVDLSEDLSKINSAVSLEQLESTSELSSICDVGGSQNEMQTADSKERASDEIENRSVAINESMEKELGANLAILEENKFTSGVTDENAEVLMEDIKNDINNTFHDDLPQSENIPQCRMIHVKESTTDDKPRENDVQDEIPKREGNLREAEGNIEHGNGCDVGRENGSDIGGGVDVSIDSESHFARGSENFKTDRESSTTNSRFQENENVCSEIDANLIEQYRTDQCQNEQEGVASRVDGCSNGVNVLTDTIFEENSEGKHLEEGTIADKISTGSLKPQQALKVSTIKDEICSETSNQSSEANESINSSNSDEGQSDSINSKDDINNERATSQSEQRVNDSIDDNSTSDSVIDNVPNTQVSSQLVSDQIHTNICNDFGSVSVNNKNNSVHSFESDKDSCDAILDANNEEIVNKFPESVENNSNNLSGIGKSADDRFIDPHSHFIDDSFNSVDESCDHNKTNVDTDDHSTESSLLPLESNSCQNAPNTASNSVRYPESSNSSDSAAVKSSRESQEISKDSTSCSRSDSQISVVRPPENEGYETQPISYSKNERQRTSSPSEATFLSTNDRSIPGSPLFQGPAPRTICENDISESISPKKTFEDDCSSNAAQEPSDAQSENQQESRSRLAACFPFLPSLALGYRNTESTCLESERPKQITRYLRDE
nr:PREDICTED: TNF receptor-associated factor family protein DDB_G0272098-like [Bemisia tabaci]